MTEPLSVDEVVAAQEAGRPVRFLYFWGHRAKNPGVVGKECLSQWWPVPFTVDGTAYATAEHYMMAGKARLFGDDDAVAKILAAPDPGKAKALGRTVRGFDEAAWVAARDELVYEGNLAKFGQHPDLAEFLTGTGGSVLVEASPLDRIWGIGLAGTDGRAGRAADWLGLNLLGFALMRVRAALRGT